MKTFVSIKNFKSVHGDVLSGTLFLVNDAYDLPIPSNRPSYYIHDIDHNKYFTELDLVMKMPEPEMPIWKEPKPKKSGRPTPLPVSGSGVDDYNTPKRKKKK